MRGEALACAPKPVALSSGYRLGPYEILGPLGAGGMGEVYEARDLRLKRILAIKVLPEAFSAEPERLRRFEREARAASALNHPSILSVYDVGIEGSVSYIAMEHVDGQTLRDLLRLGPLPLRKVLEIAVAIAEGLCAAHEAGIVHRDVKPANVMVSRQGFVKILDFGVAKIAHDEPRAVDSDTTTASVPGKLLGTVAYMSPEQARGDAVDFRSDQFSLGSVLYEVVSCRRAFSGGTEADTLAAILQQEPEPLARIAPHVPAPLRWVIERCLAKAPADRYAATRDLARELGNLKERLSEISTVPESAPPLPRSRWRVAAGAAALLLAVAAALSWIPARSTPSTREVDFRRLTLRQGAVYRALFVPNSNAILYTASWEGGPARSYLTLPDSKSLDRSLDAEMQVPMAYAEDGSEALVLLGRSRPGINAFGRLAWWPALGGRPRVVMEEAGWSDLARRARFLAVVAQEGTERTLEIRDAAGGKQRTLFRTTGGISYVRISPDEKHVAFIHHPSRMDDAGEVRVVAADGGSESRAISPRFLRCAGMDWHPPTGAVWVSATRENMYRTSLWAADLSGQIRLLYSFPDYFILSDISDRGEALVISGTGGASLHLSAPGAPMRDYTWLGSTIVTDISPDAKSLLFTDGGPAMEWTAGTWVRPLDGTDAVRIGDGDAYGKFSPDGKWVVTASRPASAPPQLVLMPAAGGEVRQITSSAVAHADPSFLDAQTLLFVRSDGQRREVWRMAVDGTQARSLGAAGCDAPVADPAGRSFLCIGGTRRNAIVVHPLDGAPERRIFDLPGSALFLYARWTISGKEILAVTNEGRLLTLSPESGLLRDEGIALPRGSGSGALLSAAFSPDAKVRAYSTQHFSSRLYLCRGL